MCIYIALIPQMCGNVVHGIVHLQYCFPALHYWLIEDRSLFFPFYMQFSGINGVLYYTPQILEQAGVGVLLSNLGISSSSASLLISGITTLLMLPSIAVAMRLMDVAGRRYVFLPFSGSFEIIRKLTWKHAISVGTRNLKI